MLAKDRFKELMPEISSIKRIADEGKVFWRVFDEEQACIGYGIFMVVPETDDPSLDVEEFDKYEVTGILNLDYEITALKIAEHPDGPDSFWVEDILEDDFARQYLNKTTDDMYLNPDGVINAISDGTLSSKLMTDSIREKILEIKEYTQE